MPHRAEDPTDPAHLARMADTDPPEFDRVEIIPSVTVFLIVATMAAVALLCLSSLVACVVKAVL